MAIFVGSGHSDPSSNPKLDSAFHTMLIPLGKA